MGGSVLATTLCQTLGPRSTATFEKRILYHTVPLTLMLNNITISRTTTYELRILHVVVRVLCHEDDTMLMMMIQCRLFSTFTNSCVTAISYLLTFTIRLIAFIACTQCVILEFISELFRSDYAILRLLLKSLFMPTPDFRFHCVNYSTSSF